MSERRRRRILEDEDHEEEEDEDDEEEEDDEESEGSDENEETGQADEPTLQAKLQQNSDTKNEEEIIAKIPHLSHENVVTENGEASASSPGDKKKSARNSRSSREKEKATDPFSVPRGTRFFLHDDRKIQGKTPQPKPRSGKSDDLMDWKHDKFDEMNEGTEEGPKLANTHPRRKPIPESENSVWEESGAFSSAHESALSSHRTERGGRRGRGRVVTSVRGRGRGRIHLPDDEIARTPQPSRPESPLETMSFPPPNRDRRGGRTRRGRGRGPPSLDPNAETTPPSLSQMAVDGEPESGNVRRIRGGRSQGPPSGESHPPLSSHESEPQAWQWNSESRGDEVETSSDRFIEPRERRGGRTSRGGRGRTTRGGRTGRNPQEFSSPSLSEAQEIQEFLPQRSPSEPQTMTALRTQAQAPAPPPSHLSQDISPVESAPSPSSSSSSLPMQQTKHSNQLKATAHEFRPHSVAEMGSHDEYHAPYTAMDRGGSLSPEYHHPTPVHQMYPPHRTPPPDSVPPPLYWNPNQQAYHPHPGYYYPPQLPYHPPHIPYHSISPEMTGHHLHPNYPHPASPYLYEPTQPEMDSQYYQSVPPYYSTQH
jgi:hypothetical protein